jgi:type IV secretory pathway TrbD component
MSDDQDVDVISLHSSMMRPVLAFGMEPWLGLTALAAAVGFILILQRPLAVACGIAILTIGIPLLRRQAKADPHYSTIMTRRAVTPREYAARPLLGRRPASFRKQLRIDRPD